mmetsp:Transcript_38568/g.89642  ORF Transcript_38568/g.89642 Transcript_38568/m.89642 type:complete len:92 (-) Transcript_38568:3-278(-)
MSNFFVNNATDDLVLPATELYIRPPLDDAKEEANCPKSPPIFINRTDNSLLCKQVVISESNFPFRRNATYDGESIPIFWSGSSSFQTFFGR